MTSSMALSPTDQRKVSLASVFWGPQLLNQSLQIVNRRQLLKNVKHDLRVLFDQCLKTIPGIRQRPVF